MIGPVQVLVVGFDRPAFSGEVLAELARLKDAGVVRLVDLLLVSRASDGTLETVGTPAGAGADLGGLVTALLGQPQGGAGASEGPVAGSGSGSAETGSAESRSAESRSAESRSAESRSAESRSAGARSTENASSETGSAAWSLADAVPPGSAAAVALIEHTWAADLVAAIQRAGGRPLEETWLAPDDRERLDALLAQRAQQQQRTKWPAERG